jgi:hypothetical protein
MALDVPIVSFHVVQVFRTGIAQKKIFVPDIVHGVIYVPLWQFVSAFRHADFVLRGSHRTVPRVILKYASPRQR